MRLLLAVTLALSLFPTAWAQAFKLEGNQLVLPAAITFKTGSAELDEKASLEALKHIQEYLTAKTYISKVRIEAHTDTDGDTNTNQKLTEQRALAVAQWLKAQGIDCQRLLPVGFGGTKPVAANTSPAGKSQNRRVTVVNAELRGRAIGGLPVDGGGKVAGDPCK